MIRQEVETIKSLNRQLETAIAYGSVSGDLSSAQSLQAEIDSRLTEIRRRLWDEKCPYPGYKVQVNYDLSLEELVKMGKYNWVDDDINSTNFSSSETGQKHSKIYLFGFKQDSRSELAIQTMNDLNMRPATLKELLTLSYQYPDLIKKQAIASLSQLWPNLSGELLLPCLYCADRYERRLCLLASDRDWIPFWRFAAVRK